jgi:hypothetical protein
MLVTSVASTVTMTESDAEVKGCEPLFQNI